MFVKATRFLTAHLYHDILDVMGVEALAGTSSTIQTYRLQGVKINDAYRSDFAPDDAKNEIQEVGDTTFLVGEHIDREKLPPQTRNTLKTPNAPPLENPFFKVLPRHQRPSRSFPQPPSRDNTCLDRSGDTRKVDDLTV